MTTDPILVVLSVPEAAAACLHAAAQAARALPDAPIEVLHVHPDPAGAIMLTEEVLPEAQRAAIERQEAKTAAALRATFDAWRVNAPTAVWQQVRGNPANELLRRAAGAALVVLARPGTHPHHLDRAAFDAAVFQSGKPVLAVPPGWSGMFHDHLAVGWRDTATTHRAIEAVRPWLAAATRITVLEVGDGPPASSIPPLAGLSVAIDHRAIRADGMSDAEALLAAAAAAGADGLVMGAYRRGRLLEWVLGGVTEHVLRCAELPVLLRH